MNSPQVDTSRVFHCGDNSRWFKIVGQDPFLTYTVATTGGVAIPATFGYNTSHAGTTEFAIKVVGGATSASFTVTATNECGVSSVVDETFEATYDCRGTAATAYELYPNPATDEVLIQPAGTPGAPDKAAPAKQGISSVQVFDSYGQLRLTQRGNEAAAVRLRVGQLPAGLYIVHVLRGQTIVSSQRLQIKR